MPYYTFYSIDIDGYEGHNEEYDPGSFIADQIEEWKEKGFYPFDDSCKWYDHEEDMKEFSKKYPDMVFHLYGEGEDNTDMWYKHFKNGKMQVCPALITFDDYDEDELV